MQHNGGVRSGNRHLALAKKCTQTNFFLWKIKGYAVFKIKIKGKLGKKIRTVGLLYGFKMHNDEWTIRIVRS